jgi:hypothetical protein
MAKQGREGCEQEQDCRTEVVAKKESPSAQSQSSFPALSLAFETR